MAAMVEQCRARGGVHDASEGATPTGAWGGVLITFMTRMVTSSSSPTAGSLPSASCDSRSPAAMPRTPASPRGNRFCTQET